MFADFAVVLVFAGIGVAIVYFLFASVSHAPAVKVVKVAEKPVVKKVANKPSKAELKKKEQEEKELDDLIAREAVSSRGMHSAKYEVVSLEDHREKARNKAHKGKGGAAIAEAKKEFTEEEKVKERASGFKVVVKEEKAPAPKAAVGAAHTGTRVSSPKTSAASARDELDRKLSQFFKSNSGKKRNNDDAFDPLAKKEDKPVKQGMRVDIKKTINAATDDVWNASADAQW